VNTTFGKGKGEILHFDTKGHLLATIPLPDDGAGSSIYPPDFAVAPDGSFWVPQPNSGSVIHTDPAGKLLALYGEFGTPNNVTLGASGQVYVADVGLDAVLQLNPATGTVKTLISNLAAVGVNFTPQGNLTVSDINQGILTYTTAGKLVQKITDSGNVDDAEVDLSGNTFAGTFSTFAVDKFDPHGKLLSNTLLNGEVMGLAVVGVDGPAPPPDTTDYYSFTLAKGQSAAVALTDLGPGATGLALQDASGTVLAQGKVVNSNVSEAIGNFVARAAGTYYVQVTGNDVPYSLVVTKGAAFDTEKNDTLKKAQPLAAAPAALGFVSQSSPDYYWLSAKAGQTLVFTTATPADGPGQFHNTLDPKLNLYNAAGQLVASDDNSAPDGRNARLTYKVPVTGKYFIQVLPSNLTATPTAGEYVLSVQSSSGSLPPLVVRAPGTPGMRRNVPLAEVLAAIFAGPSGPEGHRSLPVAPRAAEATRPIPGAGSTPLPGAADRLIDWGEGQRRERMAAPWEEMDWLVGDRSLADPFAGSF
jgi:sugar lactone lactonase YvrE